MSDIMEKELGWDDQIEKDGGDFVLLPEGDYNFEVIDFERARHPGSEKLPACNKAVIKIKVQAPEGSTIINHNLFLHTITEGMLSAFFAGIGMKKKGERVTMNWNAVPGSTGRARISIHKYRNKDGEERQSNEIKKFYPKEGPSTEGRTFETGKF